MLLVRWPVEMLSCGESSVMVMNEPQIRLWSCMCCGHIIPFSVSVGGSFAPISCLFPFQTVIPQMTVWKS